jgi:NAD(P)-dependent dehydrogenase (short-subunit alcohol dehydrogenase family)
MAHCSAAKGALNSLSRNGSRAWAVQDPVLGVSAFGEEKIPDSISPDEAEQPVIELMEARNPLGRIGRVDDLEGIAIYLASDLSRYHTGDTITIDGGHRASIY